MTVSERANTAALTAKLETAQDRIATLESTARQLQGEIDGLAVENADLKLRLEEAELSSADFDELARAREEAQRYKEGLERAVETLNQRAGRSSPSMTPPETPLPARSAVYVRQPQALVTDLDVTVAGTLHNAGSEVAVGYLELTLWIDGRQDDSTTMSLEIAPRTVTDYDWTFRNVIEGGQSAQVEAAWGDTQQSMRR